MTTALSLFDPAGPEPGPTTIEAVVRAYLADAKTELAKTTHADRRRVGLAFAAAFAGRQAETLRPSEVKAWILGRPEWTKPTTQWGALNVVKRILNWAVDDRLLRLNPVKKLRLEQGEPRRPTSEWEFQVMLRASSPCFRRVLCFLRSEGCRPQDVRELEWPWIVWQLGVAIVPKTRHKTGRQTKKDKVMVLTPYGVKLLLWLQRQTVQRTGKVFLNQAGRPWTRTAFGQRLQEIRRKTGLAAAATLHGIRHLAGTTVAREGGSIMLLSKGMGHASTGVTEKFYVNLGLAENDIDAIRKTMLLGARRPRRIKPPAPPRPDQLELF